jgi:hypothetical protein
VHPLPDRAFKTSPFRAGFGAPTGLKAGVLNQQGKRIRGRKIPVWVIIGDSGIIRELRTGFLFPICHL